MIGVGRRLAVLAFTLVLSCERVAAQSSAASDAGRAVAEDRIVCVGSSVTEAVYALGAGERVIGVDTSSSYPEATAKLPHVGYQRTLSAEGILALRPTLLITTGEAGPSAVLDQLKAAGLRVEILSVEPTIAAAKSRIARVGELVGLDSTKLLADLELKLQTAGSLVRSAGSRPKVLALYSRGPNLLLVFGRNTVADTMIQFAGGENAVTAFEGTKPLTSEAVVQAAPEMILIPSRGLESLGGTDGLLKTPGIADTPAGRNRRIVDLDDALLLGFGPRIGAGVLELVRKLHPEARDTP